MSCWIFVFGKTKRFNASTTESLAACRAGKSDEANPSVMVTTTATNAMTAFRRK